MFSYYAMYLIGRCEGEISLVRPFICVVPSLPPPPSLSSVAPPLTCTLRKVTIPFREPSERAPPERIGHFPSSVSSSRGCAGVFHKCAATLEKKKKRKKTNQKSQNSFVSFTSSSFLPPLHPPTFPLSLFFSCLSQAVNTLHLRNQTRLTHRAL